MTPTKRAMNPRVEGAAARYVEAVVARYGAASALSRTRMLTHERSYRNRPQWLIRAIEMLQAQVAWDGDSDYDE